MSPETMGGIGAVLSDELARARAIGAIAAGVVLVEGASDRVAIETLARRRDRDLEAEGVFVIPIAGATNIGRFLDLLGTRGFDVPLAGLCDEGEAPEFCAALAGSGLGDDLEVDHLDRAGFFVCRVDLEDELIRALGAEGVMGVMERQRQLRSFRRFQRQPAQRGKAVEAQLLRWMGNHKIRYASLMVAALDLDDVPEPLNRLLDHI